MIFPRLEVNLDLPQGQTGSVAVSAAATDASLEQVTYNFKVK